MEALAKSDSQVCSIYSPDTVTKVFDKIKQTKSGHAIFTYPNSPVKCPGAPQKIAYLAEEYWRKVRHIKSWFNFCRHQNLSIFVHFPCSKISGTTWKWPTTRHCPLFSGSKNMQTHFGTSAKLGTYMLISGRISQKSMQKPTKQLFRT